jgi:hypothetical protein
MPIFANNTKVDFEVSDEKITMIPKTSVITNEVNMIRTLLVVLGMSMINLMALSQEARTYDGTDNNQLNSDWGAKGTQLVRFTDVSYSDKISTPSGVDRPNPRIISNALFDQNESIIDRLNLSDFVWVFGQFIDHDISLTENNVVEPQYIPIPDDDKYFTPGSHIFTFRSMPAPGTGTSVENPRQHENAITSFVDGSGIYGSDIERANWLRTFENGKLKTSEGDLLPWNTVTGEFNAPKDPSAPFMADDTFSGTKLYVAGDIRANENPLLIAFHTIFVREHNRICDKISILHPDWSDEEIYQHARKWTGAYLQKILYYEWLPAMGVRVPEYVGYKPDINPGIFNVFSASAFRLGHTLINSNIIRMDNRGGEIDHGHMTLKDAFFNPLAINLAGGIEPYLKGMATQVQQEMDCKMIHDVRNFLFGSPDQGGLDLASINILRGRERGLPDYNTVRENFGLPRVSSFEEMTDDSEAAVAMESLYGNVDNIDSWVGMLAEYHMPNAILGESIMTIIEKQFQVLRDGDRFYFENDLEFTTEDMEEIQNTSFRDIIMRNTEISLMQDNVFVAMPHDDIPNGPKLAEIQLEASIYPNPTLGDFTVKVFMEEEIELNISVFDANGRLVLSKSKLAYVGENFMHLKIGDQLPRGIYNVLVEAGYEFSIKRIIKE